MKKHRSIFKAVTLGVITTLVLAACSSTSTTSGSGTKSAGNVTMNFSFSPVPGDDSWSNWLKDNVKLYEQKHPNVKINITDNATSDAYQTKITTQLAGGNPPDIFQGWTSGRMKPFIDSGRVLDITDIFNKDAQLKNSFTKFSLSGTTFNGKLYGLPSELASEVIYYNKKVFADNGLSIPTTYEELLHVIDVLKGKSITPIVVANSEPWNGTVPYMFITERIGGLKAYQDTVINHSQPWTSKPFVDAAQKLQELIKAGAFNQNLNSTNTDQAVALLSEGKAAMYMNGTWMISGLVKTMKDNVGFFNFPTISGGKGSLKDIILLPNSALYISQKTKNKDTAVDFLKFCFSKDRQIALAKAGFLIAENIDLPAGTVNPLAAGVHKLQGEESGSMYPWDVPVGVFMGKELNNATQRIYNGGNPVEVLKNLEQLQNNQK